MDSQHSVSYRHFYKKTDSFNLMLKYTRKPKTHPVLTLTSNKKYATIQLVKINFG